MDNNDLKERDFEAYIEHWLVGPRHCSYISLIYYVH